MKHINLAFILFFSLTNIVLAQDPTPDSYNRSDWRHWIDKDHDCQNERAELLIEQSLTPVTFKNDKNCVVTTGKWNDFYYDEVHTSANKVDIDHVVPLKHAHDHGGASWTREQKKTFANDHQNMVITNRSYNRSKGAQDITTWLPIKKSYACKYMSLWFAIKKKYALRIDQIELDHYELARCE